jgi:hypothetical protein
MSIWLDYFSELRPPSLFVPQVIYEHGEQWWNDMNRRKLLISQPDISANPASSNLLAKEKEMAKKTIHFAL